MTAAPYWVPLGAAPRTAQVWYGTTPPASPIDGDEWVFPADAAAGVQWRFRYRAASASAYKWEFVGGASLVAQVYTEESTAAPGPVDLATVGPSLVPPRNGDYLFLWSWFWYASGTSGVATVTVPLVGPIATALTSRGGASVSRFQGAVSGSTTYKLQYGYSGSGGAAAFAYRCGTLTPVRVS